MIGFWIFISVIAILGITGLVLVWHENKANQIYQSQRFEEINQNFDFVKKEDLQMRFSDPKTKSAVYNPRKDEDFAVQVKNESYWK